MRTMIKEISILCTIECCEFGPLIMSISTLDYIRKGDKCMKAIQMIVVMAENSSG